MVPLEVRQRYPAAPKEYRIRHTEEWMELERNLVIVRNLLQDHEKAPVLVGIGKLPVPGPSSEGYHTWSTDKETAQRRAYFARRRFLYHITMISFHIAALWNLTNDPHAWYDYLAVQKVKGTVLDSFSASVVADFSPRSPRAGLFVKPNECTWPTYLPVCILANIPVFVCWGPVSSPVPAPYGFTKLKPSKEEIVAAQELSVALGGSSTSTSTSHSTTSGSVPRFLPTDTPGKFFAARATYGAARIRVETEEEKNARLSQEKRATDYAYGQDAVFEWDYDHEKRQWQREKLSKKNRTEIWLGYSRKYKRYDPVTREWDLAWFLGYSSVQDARDTEELDEEEDADHSSNPFFRKEDYGLDPLPPPDPFAGRETDEDASRGSFEDTMHPSHTDGNGNTNPVSTIETSVTSAISARPPATAATRPPTTTISHARTATSWIPTSSTAWMPPAVPTMPMPQEDGELPSNGEWTPTYPTLIGVLMARHLFRWGASDLPTIPPKKTLLWPEACKTVGFLATPELEAVLNAEKPEGAANFVGWVSCVVENKALPGDWCLLAEGSTSRFRGLLRSTDLRIFHIEDPYSGCRLWCLDDRQNGRYMRTWFVAVENPSTALAVAMSVRSIDEGVQWMLTSGTERQLKIRVLCYY